MASVDFYQGGDLDILIGTSSGEVYIANNLGDSVLEASRA